VIEKGGLIAATDQMNHYRDQAITRIMEFPETPARDALVELVNYVTTREK